MTHPGGTPDLPYPNVPAAAYPISSYRGERLATPDQVRVDSTGRAIVIWVADWCAGVSRTADDGRLQALINLSQSLVRAGQQAEALALEELQRRERERAAAAEAAQRAVEHPHDEGGDTTATSPRNALPPGVEPFHEGRSS